MGDAGTLHECGVAIGKFGTKRYAIVGTPTPIAAPDGFGKPQLLLFDIDDPGYMPSAPAQPIRINLWAADDLVHSTPLILPNRWVVVQTAKRLLAYDLSSLPTVSDSPVWRSEEIHAKGASPTLGYTTAQESVVRLFAQGYVPDANPSPGCAGTDLNPTYLVSIDPTISSANPRDFEWEACLRRNALWYEDFHCPAVGRLHPNDLLFDEGRGPNLVYSAVFGGDAGHPNHVFAAFADGATYAGHSSRLAWGFRMDQGGTPWTLGSYASPSLHPAQSNPNLSNAIVMTSDDGGIYGLKNRSDQTGINLRRWTPISSVVSWSSGAALSPQGDIISVNEGNGVRNDLDLGTARTEGNEYPLAKDSYIRATIAIDDRRAYVTTRGNADLDADAKRIVALCYASGQPSTATSVTWRYLPSNSVGGHNLQRDFHGSVSIDSYGNVLAVNDGYLIVLGVLMGDANGDGCRNNYDIDAIADLIADPAGWDTTYGRPRGVNPLGVGDCNNDGVVDNFDIDCLVDIVISDPRCQSDAEFVGWCDGGGAGLGAGAGNDFGFETDREPTAEDWAHFWSVVARLRGESGG